MSLVPRVVSSSRQPGRLPRRGAKFVGVLVVMLVGFGLVGAPASAQDVPNPPSDRQTTGLVDRVNKLLELEPGGPRVGVPEDREGLGGIQIGRLMEEAKQLCAAMQGQEDTSNALAQLCKGVTSRPGGSTPLTPGQLFDNARKNPLNLVNPNTSLCTGGSIRVPPRVLASQDRGEPAKVPGHDGGPKDGRDGWECNSVSNYCTKASTEVRRGETHRIVETFNGETGDYNTEDSWSSRGSNYVRTDIFHPDGTHDFITTEYRNGREYHRHEDMEDRNDPGLHHVTQYRNGSNRGRRLPDYRDSPGSSSGGSGRPPLMEELNVDGATGIPVEDLARETCTEADKRWNNLVNLLYRGDGTCPSPVEDDPAKDDAVGPAPGGVPCSNEPPPEPGSEPNPTDPGGPGLGDGNGLNNRPLLRSTNLPYLPNLLGRVPCMGPTSDCAPQ